MKNITINIGGKDVTLALSVEDTQANPVIGPFDRTAVQVAADITVDGKNIGGILFQTEDHTSALVANVLTSEVPDDASKALFAACFPAAVEYEDYDERAAFHAAFEPAAEVATVMHREYVSAARADAANRFRDRVIMQLPTAGAGEAQGAKYTLRIPADC